MAEISCIVLLAKPALIALKDYEAQKKQGLDPVFNSKKLGIKNAEYWEEEYTFDREKEKVSEGCYKAGLIDYDRL